MTPDALLTEAREWLKCVPGREDPQTKLIRALLARCEQGEQQIEKMTVDMSFACDSRDRANEQLAEVRQENTALRKVLDEGSFDELTLRHYGKRALGSAEIRLLQQEAVRPIQAQLTEAQAHREALQELVTRWRADVAYWQRIPSRLDIQRGMAEGRQLCADELDAVLRRHAEAPQPPVKGR